MNDQAQSPVEKTRRRLLDIPELYALLGLFRMPSTGGGEHEGSSGGPKSRPPVDLELTDLLDRREKPDAAPTGDQNAELDRLAGGRRQGALPTLASWTRLVDGELWDEDIEHAGPAETPTVLSECSFLVEHLGWCGKQQWFDELAADIRILHRDLREGIGDHGLADEELTCTECGWGVQEMDLGSWFRCAGCGKAWTRIELHRMAERRKPRPLAELAATNDVSIRTLRRAIAERRLRPAARAGATDLFDPLDVAAIAARSKLQTMLKPAKTERMKP